MHFKHRPRLPWHGNCSAIAASSAQRFFIVTTFLPILSKPCLRQSPPHHLSRPQHFLPVLPPPNPSPIPSTTSQTLTFCNSDLSPRPQVLHIYVILSKSEDEFSTAVSKAKDGAVPTLFYFTAVWCGPCRFISPIIGELSEQYPRVTTYKVDIDEPTFQFFKDGKKVTQVVGANVARLRNTFGSLGNTTWYWKTI
ncbi:thioredoxin O, mitochondrial-like [Malus sylvestris]|uniref:thioredoxin O, mitochondrial-like n=1 Tax=Malus sylvestris TaxID=3752 RepID=UPI0021ACAEC9|nr:thioredoxin O, mitochondrial-like [Malus sylvestris]